MWFQHKTPLNPEFHILTTVSVTDKNAVLSFPFFFSFFLASAQLSISRILLFFLRPGVLPRLLSLGFISSYLNPVLPDVTCIAQQIQSKAQSGAKDGNFHLLDVSLPVYLCRISLPILCLSRWDSFSLNSEPFHLQCSFSVSIPLQCSPLQMFNSKYTFREDTFIKIFPK